MNDSRAEFICGDFVNDSAVYSRRYDYAYSRFTLHAITLSQQNELLRNIKHVLKPDGKFFIEARTLKDNLYGKGESAGDNAFIYDGHYRRFIDPEELVKDMESMGWRIISLCVVRCALCVVRIIAILSILVYTFLEILRNYITVAGLSGMRIIRLLVPNVLKYCTSELIFITILIPIFFAGSPSSLTVIR